MYVYIYENLVDVGFDVDVDAEADADADVEEAAHPLLQLIFALQSQQRLICVQLGDPATLYAS